MKNQFKKLLGLVMALVLALSVMGCSADPNWGNYICTEINYFNEKGSITELYSKGASLELKAAGLCTVVLDGESFEGTWEMDNSNITISLQGEDSVGTIADNTISVDLYGTGITYNFVKN